MEYQTISWFKYKHIHTVWYKYKWYWTLKKHYNALKRWGGGGGDIIFIKVNLFSLIR